MRLLACSQAHTILLHPSSNLLCPLCAVCPCVSLCMLTWEHLYLVQPDSVSHLHTVSTRWSSVTRACMFSCDTAHRLALILPWWEQQISDERKERLQLEGNGAQGLVDFTLHPPIAFAVTARHDQWSLTSTCWLVGLHRKSIVFKFSWMISRCYSQNAVWLLAMF